MKSPWLWLATVTIVIALMLFGLRSGEHAPTAAPRIFDAANASATLERLNPERAAHPVGSAHNQLIRTRIEAELRALGYSPEIQAELICTNLSPGCSFVENVIAVKDGAGDDAIMVTAHYDSAPISPGAGDDLAGIAVMLEIAREIADRETQNDIVFLFADGEEAGLRGAMAFAEHHPLMERIDLVLNMEARGVTGPSSMFETSANAERLVGIFAESATHPVANSLFYEVYRHMPNNTDVTIYKNHGAMAMNFAFSRGAALYHSARDDAAHLSRDSLAHHGDNVLSALLPLADTRMDELRQGGNATYVDVFGSALLHWPSVLNAPAAATLVFLLLGLGVARRAIGWTRVGWAALAIVAIVVAHVALGWLLSFPLGIWPGIHPLDHPFPWPGRIALIASSVLTTLAIGATLSRKAGAEAMLFVGWLFVALLGLGLAVLLPGGSYLTLLPVGAFAVVATVETVLQRTPIIAASIGFVVAAYMALYHFLSIDVVFNFQSSYLKTPILVLMSLAAAPLAAWSIDGFKSARLPLAASALVCVAAAIAGYLAPAYTPDRPRAVNVDYLQIANADTATAQWRLATIGPADTDHAARAGFPAELETFLRWGLRETKAYLRPAPALALPEPQWRVLSETPDASGARVVDGEVQAGRGGFLFGLTFAPDADVDSLTVEDTVLANSEAFDSPRGLAVTFSGIGERALRVRLVTRSAEPVGATLFEVSPLPEHPEAAAIIAARPDNAAPIHFGDHAEVQRHLTF